MLVGLGAVGVASAGAGLGTTAYFNDTETFANNELTAGSLDLFVHVDYSEDQGSYAQYSTEPGTYVDGNVVGIEGQQIEGEPLSIQVSDLKPGDSGEGEFCFSIVDNPAYMWMCGELTANDENGMTEPEMDDDETPDTGDLADAMEVTVSYCTPDGDGGNVIGDEIVSGSLAEVMLALQAGVPLSSDGDANAPLADRPTFDGVTEAFTDGEPNVDEQCVCFTWEVPTSVENEIQTDSVMFDFEFYAVQARHNDGAHNPCVEFDTVVTTDPGPGVDRDGDGQGDATGSWITARVSSGPTTVVQVELDGDVYGGGNSGLGEWPSNPNAYVVEANFDVDTDGLGESPNDDFRFGYGSASSGARSGGIANSTSGASGDGGYIRRNIGTGGNNNRTDTAAEDVPGFVALESADQLTYTFVIDWTSGLPALSSVPTQFVLSEVFASDGGEGVASPNSSNDGRAAIDNVTDASGVINV
ncbi:SipW-cognate class signal peptide [Halorubrum sodomense]|uniref:SipW-cognate class signal peptide n=2 Tax=Haloferacaceae TaxID=1644056 RepID=A0A1I6FRJ6_HALSD|nr:SipW-cognate class signal peptide [Halorubrum sodomense]